MKKKIVIMLMVVVSLGVTGCGESTISSDKTVKKEVTKDTEKDIGEVNNIETGGEEEKEEEMKTQKESNKKVEEKVEKQQSVINRDTNLKEIKLNEPYLMETDNGNYSFTITGVQRTDWIQEADKEIIVLDYVVENENYEPDNGSLLLLDAKAFRMEDAERNVLEAWDSTMSEFGFPDFVEVGEKKEQQQPYVTAKDTEEIRLVFEKEGEDIADMVVSVK